VEVDIDLALSAYANSRALYEAKKKTGEKAGKTLQGEGEGGGEGGGPLARCL
jgi:hypothetical protein